MPEAKGSIEFEAGFPWSRLELRVHIYQSFTGDEYNAFIGEFVNVCSNASKHCTAMGGAEGKYTVSSSAIRG